MKSFGATLFLVAIILLSVLPSLREEAVRREIVQQAEEVASEIQNQPPQRSAGPRRPPLPEIFQQRGD